VTSHPFVAQIEAASLALPYGRVRKVASGYLEASGPACTVGDICAVESDGAPFLAEVATADETGLILVPLELGRSARPRARVYSSPMGDMSPVGAAFSGRAIDALARSIDGRGPMDASHSAPLAGAVPRPLDRIAPAEPVATGIRALDGLLPLARGQRIGIFAASGVGKTSLVEQLVGQIECDRCVLCLVGERGREVEGIWNVLSRRDDADRFTLVAATSDESAALRVRSVNSALCLAEYWRDQGEHVVLVIDSVTRLAMALREIGLSAGEPPTVRAYTPNVFAALPRLVERCGAIRTGGAITSIMTVLSETDEVDDPVVEVMKSLLDGHIVLSRKLAERGHFPAIDVPRSISRQAPRIMSPAHAAAARDAAALLGTWEEARLLIESGMYSRGASAAIDRSIDLRDRLMGFLQQQQNEDVGFATTVGMLQSLVAEGRA
jgi:flagellum-specific ATP synthase